MGDRLAFFLLFVVLTILTFGIYPIYFSVTRLQELQTQTELLKKIADRL